MNADLCHNTSTPLFPQTLDFLCIRAPYQEHWSVKYSLGAVPLGDGI